MSQRIIKHSHHIDSGVGGDRMHAKDRQKFMKPSTPVTCIHKGYDKGRQGHINEKHEHTNNHFLKGSALSKQQNVPSGNSSPSTNVIQYSASDDSAIVEVRVKTSNPPKQRSKSTVSDREPWGQLLKKQKGGEGRSVFSSFDPLRTLHFLAKELQIHIQALLPDEKNVEEIIKAMQTALKRVPPEVASTIHLQQSIGLLPGVRKSTSQSNMDEVPEKPYPKTENKHVQTTGAYEKEEVSKIQKLMEESTVKLETSCRHLEHLCTQLKNEKLFLETQLQNEKSAAELLKRKVDNLEALNKDLTQACYKKDEQIYQMKSNLDTLEVKLQENHSSKPIIVDLKKSKSNLEQECVKLKHQLRICAIEKEKYLAILAVRDRQINEIRNEMTQLQEAVNEQLMELHANALATLPHSVYFDDLPKEVDSATNVKNLFDANRLSDKSLEELRSEASQAQNLDQDGYRPKQKVRLENGNIETEINSNIRELFSELKKQAYALYSENDE